MEAAFIRPDETVEQECPAPLSHACHENKGRGHWLRCARAMSALAASNRYAIGLVHELRPAWCASYDGYGFI